MSRIYQASLRAAAQGAVMPAPLVVADPPVFGTGPTEVVRDAAPARGFVTGHAAEAFHRLALTVRASWPTNSRAHSRFPGHALTPTGVMAIRCKQFHRPDL